MKLSKIIIWLAEEIQYSGDKDIGDDFLIRKKSGSDEIEIL